MGLFDKVKNIFTEEVEEEPEVKVEQIKKEVTHVAIESPQTEKEEIDLSTEKLEKKLEKEGIAVAGRAQVGPTIGSHVGPEAYGVIFVRKKKLEVKIFE